MRPRGGRGVGGEVGPSAGHAGGALQAVGDIGRAGDADEQAAAADGFHFTIAEARHAVHVQSMSLSEILPGVRNLSAADKLRLIRILAEEVDAQPDIAPLEHGRTYIAATPTFESGAAAGLFRELQNAPQN